MANNYGAAAERFSQGYQRLMDKDYAEAITAFSEAIDLFPLFETGYRFRAEAYQNLGMRDEATADLQSVVSIATTRQQEAERILGVRSERNDAPQPTAGAAPRGGLLQSPLARLVGIIAVVMIVAGAILIIVAGR